MDLLYGFISSSKELGMSNGVIVFPSDLTGFEAWLRSQGRAPRTVRGRLAYLHRLVNELGHRVELDELYGFLARQAPGAREHFLKALRLFLQYSGRGDLLDRVRGGWQRPSRELKLESAVSLEDALSAIGMAADMSMDYALYLSVLLVSGLRPHEARLLRWGMLVEPQIFKIEKQSRLKRAYHAFITPRLYMLLVKSRRGERVVHYRRETEYHVLKRIREELPHFRPYELRALNAALLVRAGIPESVVKYLHGWAPESVLRRFYLDKQMSLVEMLLDVLSKHNEALEHVDSQLEAILGQVS